VSAFERDGFLVLPQFVSAAACDQLRERALQLVNEFDPQGLVSVFSTREQSRLADDYFLGSGDKIRFFFEADAFLPDGKLKQSKEESINKIGHALHDLDPLFSSFSRTSELQKLVAELGVRDPLLLQSMYILKQPRIVGEVNCHQDSTFLFTEPIDIVGFWFALEDAIIENGCLWVIPGGHDVGLLSRWVRVQEGGMRFQVVGSGSFNEEKLVPLEAPKGTLIVLHGLLPHRSQANRSAKSRHAYTLHVKGGQSLYPADNWLQRPPEMPLRGF